MKPRPEIARTLLLLFLSVLALPILQAQSPRAAVPVTATAIPKDHLVLPEPLHHELATHDSGHPAPILFHVGSRFLFDQAHIPGSFYAGPTSRPQGLATLRARVASLPHDAPIVIYCGCCPWDHCPNMGPAWQMLHSMGFTNVRALYLAHNFGVDWVGRGYHAVSSH